VKRAIFVALVGFVMLVAVRPGEAQQIPGRGFTGLVCLAGVDGDGTYAVDPAGQFTLEVAGDTGSSATVTITHGQTGSTHVVSYIDAVENGRLNCGDVIVTVT
jgi:hypothetical protein